jgi:Ca2+:H+ antiporter
MALVLPSAYFAALDRGFTITEATAQTLINDKTRGEFLQMSRATAIFLLIMQVTICCCQLVDLQQL